MIKKLMKKINHDEDYQMVMAEIDFLMAKGSERVSKEDLAKIRALAEEAQVFEGKKYQINPDDKMQA